MKKLTLILVLTLGFAFSANAGCASWAWGVADEWCAGGCGEAELYVFTDTAYQMCEAAGLY